MHNFPNILLMSAPKRQALPSSESEKPLPGMPEAPQLVTEAKGAAANALHASMLAAIIPLILMGIVAATGPSALPEQAGEAQKVMTGQSMANLSIMVALFTCGVAGFMHVWSPAQIGKQATTFAWRTIIASLALLLAANGQGYLGMVQSSAIAALGVSFSFWLLSVAARYSLGQERARQLEKGDERLERWIWWFTHSESESYPGNQVQVIQLERQNAASLQARRRKIQLVLERAEAKALPGELLSYDLWKVRDIARQAELIMADQGLDDAQAEEKLKALVSELPKSS